VASPKKSMTIRLPIDLYTATSEMARRREVSVNAVVQEGLTVLLQKEEYARLYDAFGALGKDLQESDVEFASDAQWEVINRGEG